MQSRTDMVLELKQQFKQAFTPVPPHPANAAPQGGMPMDPNAAAAAGAPQGGMPMDPNAAGAPQGGMPMDPNAAAAAGAPQGGMPTDPNAAPPPQSASPEVLALMQEAMNKMQELSAGQQELVKKVETMQMQQEHNEMLKQERRKAIDAALSTAEGMAGTA